MRRPKILFLAESLNVGGAEKALVSLLKQMDYLKYDITLTLISKSGPFIGELSSIKGLTVNSISGYSESFGISKVVNALKVKAIYKWLPSSFVGNYLCRGYDVVIAFCEGFLTKWVAASSVKCRKIAWVHTDMVNNDWPVRNGVFRSFEEEKEAYHKFDAVVGVSGIASKGMVERFSCKNVTTIYNIIDSGILHKSRQIIPLCSKRRLNIVSVGRLEYVKGYDRLIDAFNILINANRFDISLVLVGDGSQRQDLENSVRNYGLGDYVSFIGIQSNPYPYIANADVFVCPSRQEGFNIAILEAMTLGKPIIATDCAGPAEILEHGRVGILASNDIDGLVRAIIELYEKTFLIEEYAQLAKRRCRYYDSETQIQALGSLIMCD